MGPNIALNIASLLDFAFKKDEIRYLSAQQLFRQAWAKTRTAEDYEQLCALAERLLKERGDAVWGIGQTESRPVLPSGL